MLKFRNLRADEIEVRPTDTKGDKATLLLYKDARTDCRILDETVGPENWQREYYQVNGATFCRVGIWDGKKEQWIWKSDAGSENNFEREKSLASDSYKRACFAWGLGRELYNTPKIKITCPESYYYKDRFAMTFSVSRFKAEGEEILELEIVDRFGKVVYSLDNNKIRYTEAKASKPVIEEDGDEALEKLKDYCRDLSEDGERKAYIRSFYDYWKNKIEDGDRPRNLDFLWKKWKESPLRKDDDKRERAADALSDNE